jgi:hypothetical protein
MNYAAAILAFVFALAFTYWRIRGKDYYTGPRIQAHVVDGMIIQEGIPGTSDEEIGVPGALIKQA